MNMNNTLANLGKWALLATALLTATNEIKAQVSSVLYTQTVVDPVTGNKFLKIDAKTTDYNWNILRQVMWAGWISGWTLDGGSNFAGWSIDDNWVHYDPVRLEGPNSVINNVNNSAHIDVVFGAAWNINWQDEVFDAWYIIDINRSNIWVSQNPTTTHEVGSIGQVWTHIKRAKGVVASTTRTQNAANAVCNGNILTIIPIMSRDTLDPDTEIQMLDQNRMPKGPRFIPNRIPGSPNSFNTIMLPPWLYWGYTVFQKGNQQKEKELFPTITVQPSPTTQLSVPQQTVWANNVDLTYTTTRPILTTDTIKCVVKWKTYSFDMNVPLPRAPITITDVSGLTVKFTQNSDTSFTMTVEDINDNSLTVNTTMKDECSRISSAQISTTIVDTETENPETGNVNVFPNPATDHITINLEGITSSVDRISICNILWQEVFESSNNLSLTETAMNGINTSEFARGTYILSVRTEDGKSMQKKFIKQ